MSPAIEKKVPSPTLVSFQGNIIEVSTAAALPPGSRVQLDLTGAPEQLVGLAGKVVAITSQKGAGFRVKIRLHSVTKEQEELLVSIQKRKGVAAEVDPI